MSKQPSRKGADAPSPVEEAPRTSRSGGGLLAECRVDTFRAGGKGGQHQNKVESGVRLTHLPTGIVVTSRKHRSQHRNREDALQRLERKLADRSRVRQPRIRTRVPAREKRKRRERKAKRSQLKRLRKKPDQETP
ncbi:MAG: peptide chain release factor-like protein [Gemmatimonadetes bacterium]|nr:peptide chain release factor-like protein [Gemmatimonadota bacterium]